MPGLFDKLKEGAGKASFEAERLRRLNQSQSTLRSMGRQLDTEVATMGQQVLVLYDAGSLTQPELVETCQQIDALRQKITAQEAEIEQIRQEQPPAVPVVAVPERARGCMQCRIRLPLDVEYCPKCGAKTVEIVRKPKPVGRMCANCGATLPEGSAFCAKCGTPAEVAAPTPPPGPVTAACPRCGQQVPAEAGFCPSCGAPAKPPHVHEPVPVAVPIVAESEPERVACPHCAALIPSEAEFCPECGQPAVAGLSQPMPVPLPELDDQLRSDAEPELPSEPAVLPDPGDQPRFDAEPELPMEPEPLPEPDDQPRFDEEPEPLPLHEEVQDQSSICPACGIPVPDVADFCPACGQGVGPQPSEAEDEEQPAAEEVAPDAIACPNCQTQLPPEADFCPECGQPSK